MRTFIQYDSEGQIVAVVQTERLPDGLEQAATGPGNNGPPQSNH